MARLKERAGKSPALSRTWNARWSGPQSEMEFIFFIALPSSY
jgi:hypothetical protein